MGTIQIGYSIQNKEQLFANLRRKNIRLKPIRIKKVIDIDFIQNKVSKFYGITVHRMISSTRKREVCQPRQISMVLCKNLLFLSDKEVAEKHGGRDHASYQNSKKQ